MRPVKRSSLPCHHASGPSRLPKKRKATSCFSENTAAYSRLDLETMNRKIEELQMTTVQRMEELQSNVNKLKESLNMLENRTATNQTRSEQVDHGRFELRIEGTIKKRIFTHHKVKGINGEHLKVAIYYNGEKITSGPLASAKFEVLIIKGDFSACNQGSWTPEMFEQSLVKARKNVGTILKDSYRSELVNGEAVLDGLVFIDNSGCIDGKIWRLGIRLVGTKGVRVFEAISNCFRVLDRHGKASEKPHPPLLTTGVKYLEKVGKKRASVLEEKGVFTIKDFLQLYHKNPSGLLQILGINSECDESWKTMIGHAKECDVGPYLYSYQKNNSMLFFNSVYELVGANFGNHFRSFNILQDFEKVLVNEWKKGFFENIMNGDFKADFEMVNGLPVPRAEHDLTSISTDDAALSYDKAAGLQDIQPSDTTLFSDASPSHLKTDSVPYIRRDTDQSIISDHNIAPDYTSMQGDWPSEMEEHFEDWIVPEQWMNELMNELGPQGGAAGAPAACKVI